MGELVSYEVAEGVATVTMDDGKVNALSPEMQRQLLAALDRAEADRAAVVLAGREGVFSAGFDLQVMRAGGTAAADMVVGGFDLATRILSFPYPVVVACTGHAVAMGVFLLLCGDHRVGAAGSFKYVTNEVAIGMTMPYAAIAIARHRLTPAAFNRSMTIAAPFSPDGAVDAGFVDEILPPGEVLAAARRTATTLASSLDLKAHAATKRRVHAEVLDGIRAGIERDRAELAAS